MNAGIPVTPRTEEIFGQITEITVAESDFGPRIQVILQPEPPAPFQRTFFFPVSDRRQSKWMKFVNSFNQAAGRKIVDVQEMIGAWVQIMEVDREGEIRGETRTWTEPVVVDLFPSLAALREALAQEEPLFRPAHENGQKALGQVLKAIWQEARDPDEFQARVAGFGLSQAQIEALLR